MDMAMQYKVNEPAVIYQAFPDEVVLINLQTGIYYSVAKAGAAVLTLIAGGMPVADIVSEVGNRYDADLEVVHKSVAEFLEELQREDLIVIGEGASATEREAIPAQKLPFEPPHLLKFTDVEELLLLDPIHDVDDTGWPSNPPAPDRPRPQ
jgi:hypothetical protein